MKRSRGGPPLQNAARSKFRGNSRKEFEEGKTDDTLGPAAAQHDPRAPSGKTEERVYELQKRKKTFAAVVYGFRF